MSSCHRHYELAQSLPRAARGYWIPAAQPGAPERRPICLQSPSQGRPLRCRCWVQNLYLERPRWVPKELELPGVLQRPVVPGDRWGGAFHRCLIHLWKSSTCKNCLRDDCLQIDQRLQRQCCWSNLPSACCMWHGAPWRVQTTISFRSSRWGLPTSQPASRQTSQSVQEEQRGRTRTLQVGRVTRDRFIHVRSFLKKTFLPCFSSAVSADAAWRKHK